MLLPSDQLRLDGFLDELRCSAQSELGYPCAFDLDYSALAPFLGISLNNIGDPFTAPTYQLNSHSFEREVVSFFAELTRAPDLTFHQLHGAYGSLLRTNSAWLMPDGLHVEDDGRIGGADKVHCQTEGAQQNESKSHD